MVYSPGKGVPTNKSMQKQNPTVDGKYMSFLQDPLTGLVRPLRICPVLFYDQRRTTKSKRLLFWRHSGGFRELREACWNHLRILVPLRLRGAELWLKTLRDFLSPTVVPLARA